MSQVILSLKPQYVDLILSGEKAVELRNRVVRMEPGTMIWIYATRPVGGIVALAELDSVVHDTPAEIWFRFEREMCIDREHFDSYIDNRESVSALKLSSVRKLKPVDGIGLDTSVDRQFPTAAILFPPFARRPFVQYAEQRPASRRFLNGGPRRHR